MPSVSLTAPAGESSADRIGPHAVLAYQGDTAEAVRQRIRLQGLSGWDLVCVIDEAGRLVGVVGPITLMDILRREHVEDLHRLAGITRETAQALQAIEEPPLRRARHRLPWLVVGLGGSMVATFVVVRFESVLAAKPALAFFVPGLVYLADAIGTQSEAVAVRGLSLSHIGI